MHVFSKLYLTGGHTRIAERWIQSADSKEVHSVFLTGQANLNNIPALLKTATDARGGKLYCCNLKDSLLKRAQLLRQAALQYSTIVLHTHMDDPAPLIAFAPDGFRRSVILYNHAGHLF